MSNLAAFPQRLLFLSYQTINPSFRKLVEQIQIVIEVAASVGNVGNYFFFTATLAFDVAQPRPIMPI